MSTNRPKKNGSLFHHRAPLSRERILDVALTLADAMGIGFLSMRTLAEHLSVRAMSLYNYVDGKDDIVDSIVDRVVGEIALPRVGEAWQDQMRRRAHSAHEVLLKHPWAAMQILPRVNAGPSMFTYVNATLGCLLEAGFSAEMADHAWNAMDNHIYGFTLQELSFPFEEDAYQQAAEEYVHLIPEATYPYLHRLTALVMRGEYDGLHDFPLGLELILDGLERLRSGKGPD